MQSLWIAMIWLAQMACAAPASVAAPATPTLYKASVDKNREVLVDVEADRSLPNSPSLLVFFLFSKRVSGHDVWIYNYQFDCSRRTAAVAQMTQESRRIEPLNLTDDNLAPYPVPAASLLGDILNVACGGTLAIPASWRPASGNIRQESRWYYETYLGERF